MTHSFFFATVIGGRNRSAGAAVYCVRILEDQGGWQNSDVAKIGVWQNSNVAKIVAWQNSNVAKIGAWQNSDVAEVGGVAKLRFGRNQERGKSKNTSRIVRMAYVAKSNLGLRLISLIVFGERVKRVPFPHYFTLSESIFITSYTSSHLHHNLNQFKSLFLLISGIPNS